MLKITLSNLKNYTKEELNNIIADDEQLTNSQRLIEILGLPLT